MALYLNLVIALSVLVYFITRQNNLTPDKKSLTYR